MRVSSPHGRSYANAACAIVERVLDVGVGRVGVADEQVLAHARREQRRLLERESDLRAQAAQRDVAQVVPVEAHRAGRRVVEAGEQRRDGRLAGAGRADERERLAGVDLEVDAAQDRPLAAGVGEAHAFEADFTVGPHQGARAGLVGDERVGVEDLPHAAGRGLGFLGHGEDPAERFDRPDQHQDVRDERDQPTDRERTRTDGERTRAEHDAEREVGDEAEHPDEVRVLANALEFA